MIRFITIIILLAYATSGCTRNDGDIGPWFGTWQVTFITIDGVPDADYDGTVIMKFQNSILSSMTYNPEHSPTTFNAQWSCRDDVMTILIPDDTSGLAPGLGLPWLPELTLRVLQISGKRAELQWTDPDGGSVRIFTLKKLY